MRKITVFILLFLTVSSWAENQSILDILIERGLRSEEDAIVNGKPIINPDETKKLIEAVKVRKKSPFTVGMGVSVFSANIGSSSIGLFDTFSPIQLNYRWKQFGLVIWEEDIQAKKWISKVHRFELGSSVGAIFKADGINKDFDGIAGFNITPLTLSYSGFTAGLGMKYTTSGKFDLTDSRHWSFCIPLAYQIAIGK